MTVQTPQFQKPQFQAGSFNLASAFGGFAIGAAAVVISFVAINPTGSAATTAGQTAQAASTGTGTFTIPGTDGSGGGSTAALPAIGQTQTLANGTQVKRLSATQLQVTDAAGHTRVVTVGGSAGTASQTVGGSAGSAGSSGTSGGSASGGSAGGATGTNAGVGVPGDSGNCSGGSTDTGVSASSVSLGATVAESGIAQAFLGQARQGMEAYKNRVNSAGGVCGRQLKIKYVDDGWSSSTGQQDLQNLINEDKVFAVAVAPSSEGVNAASEAGVFDKAGVPVVGTDGLDASQYKDPYIWPVASATVTLLHVMMKKAWDAGAHNPAIVYDNQYKFGVEGANAFEKAYESLSGGKQIQGFGKSCGSGSRFCGISAGTGQYGNEVSIINNACNSGTKCDYLVLLMEPDTAEQWMATPGAPTAAQFPVGGMGAAQPLFTYSFGTTCGDKCNGMQVWTGYNPPLEQFANTAGVKQYVNDLHNTSSSADAYNQFTEGCYLGMQLLVAAMEKAGGNLTRAAVKSNLDAMNLDTGLSAAAETWSSGQHWAVGGAQGFTMQSQNGFSGWRFTTPYVTDPWLGKDFG
jgi:ABC-type branched-subunit amino acid transport system substrate-binding protein